MWKTLFCIFFVHYEIAALMTLLSEEKKLILHVEIHFIQTLSPF